MYDSLQTMQNLDECHTEFQINLTNHTTKKTHLLFDNYCRAIFITFTIRGLEKKLTFLAASRNHCFADVALVMVS